MRISIFLMFIGIGVISASTSYSQSTVLTLKVHNKALKDVFREIESKSEYIFFYNDEAVNVNKRVDLSIEKGTITQVLDKILDKTSRYKVEDRQVIIYKDNVAPVAVNTAVADVKDVDQAKVTVNGKVADNEGEPLPGVSVTEKGTTNGVLTDIDGNYSIGVKDQNSVLVYSYIGHDPVEKTIGSQKTINVVLQAKSSQLEEVIVVAYGTQKKSSVTGAISVVNSDALKTVTTPNVNAMLQGKVAGVQVLNTSGRPGEAAQIRIRGKGTLNSSVDPLWVIDGVVSGTGSQLNPNEIESISVLKDAAATALYGSRATNGVILVTTKSGRMGDHKVDVAVKLGVSYQHLGNFKLMNSRELYDYTSSMDKLENSGILSWFNEKLLHVDTDWFDLATQTALAQNYTVSYTGGGDKVRSFVSADYYTEEGTVKGFEYNRFNIRSNNDYKISNTLTFKTKISGSYWNDDNKQHSVYSAMTYLPWDRPYNADGSVRSGKEKTDGPDGWFGRDASNYLYNLQWNWARGKQLGVTGTFGAVWNIKDYLTFESNNNIGYRYHLTESYSDPRSTAAEGKGEISNSNTFTTTKYTNQLLRFNKVLNNVHDISAFLGYEYSDYMYESNGAVGRGIPPNTEVLDVATTPYGISGTKSAWAMQSVYFNANYTYNDKYMGQFSYRVDGSSRFGKDNRYGGFFTIGGGWSLHNEDFLKNVEFVNQLKLRASYGSIGNTPGSGDYGHLSTYSLNTQYNGIPAAFPDNLAYPGLKWEKCYETNVAVDARLFDRLNISVDYYIKNTSDLLYHVDLSPLSGYLKQYQNIGAIDNKGVEITISPEIIKTKDIQWNAQLNLGFNKSKVKELYGGNQQISGNKIIKEGTALDTWYLYDWAGVDIYTGQPMWYIHNDNGTKTLTTDYGKASRVMSGSSNPKYSGGIITDVSYKGFTLSAAFSFVSGNKIYHYAREFYDNDGAYITFNSMKLKDGWSRWEKPGDIATHPQAIAGGNSGSNKPSSRYLEDGSYFKMNNVTLSYMLPAKFIRKVGMKYATVSLSGENLFTITNFSGTDVELAAGGGNGSADASLYPAARRFSLGVNLTF